MLGSCAVIWGTPGGWPGGQLACCPVSRLSDIASKPLMSNGLMSSHLARKRQTFLFRLPLLFLSPLLSDMGRTIAPHFRRLGSSGCMLYACMYIPRNHTNPYTCPDQPNEWDACERVTPQPHDRAVFQSLRLVFDPSACSSLTMLCFAPKGYET